MLLQSRHLSEGPDVHQTSSSASPQLWRLGSSTGPEETRTDGRRRDSWLQETAKGIQQVYTTSAPIKTFTYVMLERQGMCLAYLWTRVVWCLAMYRGRSVSGTRRWAAAGRWGWGWEGWRRLPRRPLPNSVKTTGQNNSGTLGTTKIFCEQTRRTYSYLIEVHEGDGQHGVHQADVFGKPVENSSYTAGGGQFLPRGVSVTRDSVCDWAHRWGWCRRSGWGCGWRRWTCCCATFEPTSPARRRSTSSWSSQTSQQLRWDLRTGGDGGLQTADNSDDLTPELSLRLKQCFSWFHFATTADAFHLQLEHAAASLVIMVSITSINTW